MPSGPCDSVNKCQEKWDDTNLLQCLQSLAACHAAALLQSNENRCMQLSKTPTRFAPVHCLQKRRGLENLRTKDLTEYSTSCEDGFAVG